MAGAAQPDAGRVIVPRECRVGYVEQILDDDALNTPLLSWVQSALPDWGDFWTEWEKAHAAGDEAALTRLMARQHDLEARYGYNPEQKAQTVLSGLGFDRSQMGAASGAAFRRLARTGQAGQGAHRRSGRAAAGRTHQPPRP